ncbi:High-affinity glucose transporter rgt2 [Orbilia blumenaviensis]|uniref:High-affinity glucose transporter rgt2 n=1 Tax=Orbilia blumenaviensis TaxID=1796055 RepID=A0AAV9V9I2_9PEZI
MSTPSNILKIHILPPALQKNILKHLIIMVAFNFKVQREGSGSAGVAIAVGLFVAFGGILFGYDTGTIGGILGMDYWIKEFARNEDQNGNKFINSADKSLIVSILSVGTFFGALMSAQVADRFGRKYGLMISSIVFTVWAPKHPAISKKRLNLLKNWWIQVGVIFQTAATEIIMLVIGRLIAGLGVGLLSYHSAQVPMYQSETSPKWIRGAIVGSYQLAITIGLLLASCADQGTHQRQDTGSYRIPLSIQFVWALILFFGMMFLPETPRFLIKRGRLDVAAKSLSTLRRLPSDHPEILAELNEIKANHEYEMSIGQTSYKELLSNRSGFLRKRLLTGVGIQVFQQLSGANFIFYYGTTFFQSAGIKNSFVVSLITNCVNVVSTLPGLWLVDNWGRRNLLLFGAAGMFFCQFIVAIVGTVSQSQTAHNTLVAFVCIYIFFFASSWGCVQNTTCDIYLRGIIISNISQTRSVGSDRRNIPTKSKSERTFHHDCGKLVIQLGNWLRHAVYGRQVCVAMLKSTQHTSCGPGNANLGAKVFFVWGSFCALSFAFVWAFIYETKGFTLEQVDEIYAKVPHAWKSSGFEPTVKFVEVAEEVQQRPYEGGRRPTLSEIEASAIRRKSSVGLPEQSEKATESQVQ